MSDDRNLRDQFNILFDDFDDDVEDASEKVAEAADNALSAVGEEAEKAVENASVMAAASFNQVSDKAEEAIKAVSDTAEKAEKTVGFVDDTDIHQEELFRDIDFKDLSDVIADSGEDEPSAVTNAVKQAAETAKEAGDELDGRFTDDLGNAVDDFEFDDDFDSLTKTLEEFDEDFDGDGEAGTEADEESDEESDDDLEFEDISDKEKSEDEDVDGDGEPDDFDEDDEYEDEDDEIPVRRRPKKTAVPTAEDLRKESRNFWIFTGIVALLVVAAVLFILWRRGIIFNQPTTTETPTTTEAPTTTEVPTTTEIPTTPEPTTAEPTTEVPTTVEPSTEPDTSEVLEHYSNLFVVKADQADSLYVRNVPSPDAMVIGILYGYSGGEITGEEGEWYAVFSGSINGYVSKAYVATGNEAAVLAKQNATLHAKITAATVRVRSSADTSSDENIINTVAQGACLPYVATEGEFYRIKDPSGREGYVSVHYSNLGYYLDEAVPYRLPNS